MIPLSFQNVPQQAFSYSKSTIETLFLLLILNIFFSDVFIVVLKPKRMDAFIFFRFLSYGFYMTLVESIVFQNTPTKMNIVFFFL